MWAEQKYEFIMHDNSAEWQTMSTIVVPYICVLFHWENIYHSSNKSFGQMQLHGKHPLHEDTHLQ